MKKLTVCMAALVGFMCGVADGASAKANALNAAQVRVIGESRSVPRVDRAGRSVPLRHALEQIVPANFSINLPNAGPWADVPVSWHAGAPFVVALREALAGAPGVAADVDLKLHLVTVSASASAGASGVAGVAEAGVDAAGEMKHAGSLPPNAAPVVSQPSARPVQSAQSVQSVEAPTLLTQPPLLVAMRSAPQADVAAATKPATQSATIAPAGHTVAAAPAATTLPTATANSAPEPSTGAAIEPPPAAPPPEPARAWHLSVSDHTVKTALARWAKEDGWQLVWDVPIDFGIDADATVNGTFEQALQAVVDALKKSETPIQAVMYRGNKVLRIVAKGAA
jgi:hypothetical protein